jgi:hypothetical protein
VYSEKMNEEIDIIPDVILTDIGWKTVDPSQFTESDFVRDEWGHIFQKQPNDGGCPWWRCHRDPVMKPLHELGRKWKLRPHWEIKQILPMD